MFLVYKIIFLFILFLFVIIYIFLNLGNFIDVTTKPKKADIIVALGGDFSGCRLKKALSLYKEGFSKSGKLIYTGDNYLSSDLTRKEYLVNNNVDENNILYVNKKLTANTMEEVFFIKQYMLYNNYKSVLFVSHPQHSRRITTLAKIIAKYEESGLDLHIASCNPSWWNKNTYYLNETSWIVTIHEMIKLIYNVVKYNSILIKYTSYKKKEKQLLWEVFLKKELY